MRILVIEPQQTDRHASELEDAYRLRYRVFIEEHGWSGLTREDKRDQDEYDLIGCVHFLAYEGSELVGYGRLLPPGDGLDPELVTEKKMAALAEHPQVRGLGRLCAAQEIRGGSKVSNVGSHLLLAIVRYALNNNIEELFVETSPIFIMLFRVLGFPCKTVGPLLEYYGGKMGFAFLTINEAAIKKCHDRLDLAGMLDKDAEVRLPAALRAET